MRAYDVAYVKNPATPTPTLPIEDMDLHTIVKNYLCHKSNGLISNCMKCTSKCVYGERALELMGNRFGIPGSPAKSDSILERARKEIAVAADQKEKKQKVNKKNWYEIALKESNPIEWVMNEFGINEKQAKNKLYYYAYSHKLPQLQLGDKRRKAEPTKEEVKPAETSAETKPEVAIEPKKVEPKQETEDSFYTIAKTKLDNLKSLKAQYEETISKYNALLTQVTEQVDALQICVEAFERNE